MEGSNYIILFLIITQETSYICNVEGTNSMFQEIHMSYCVTAMWLGHHTTGNCSTPVLQIDATLTCQHSQNNQDPRDQYKRYSACFKAMDKLGGVN